MKQRTHAPSAGHHLAMRLACVLLLAGVAVARCGPPEELVGVYEEPLPLPEGRVNAVRITLFEYANEAGGTLQLFRVGEQNPLDEPYLVPTQCGWFGPGDVRANRFYLSVDASDGSGAGAALEAQVVGSSDGSRIDLTLTSGAGLLFADGASEGSGADRTLRLERNDDALVEGDCRPVSAGAMP